MILAPNLPQTTRKFAFINLALGLVLMVGGILAFRDGWVRANGDILLVLTYHGVSDAPATPMEISYGEIQSHVRILKKYGFTALKPEDLSRWWSAPKTSQRQFLVTFDDGLTSSGAALRRLTVEEEISPLLFVVTDLVGKNGYLSEESIQALASSGVGIGLHGKRHLEVTKILAAKENLAAELAEARARLEAMVGKKIACYAYPFGDYNDEARLAVASAGLSFAFTIDQGLVDKASDALRLPRVMFLRGVEKVGETGLDDWVPPPDLRRSGLMLTLAFLVLIWSFGVLYRFYRCTRWGHPGRI